MRKALYVPVVFYVVGGLSVCAIADRQLTGGSVALFLFGILMLALSASETRVAALAGETLVVKSPFRRSILLDARVCVFYFHMELFTGGRGGKHISYDIRARDASWTAKVAVCWTRFTAQRAVRRFEACFAGDDAEHDAARAAIAERVAIVQRVEKQGFDDLAARDMAYLNRYLPTALVIVGVLTIVGFIGSAVYLSCTAR